MNPKKELLWSPWVVVNSVRARSELRSRRTFYVPRTDATKILSP